MAETFLTTSQRSAWPSPRRPRRRRDRSRPPAVGSRQQLRSSKSRSRGCTTVLSEVRCAPHESTSPNEVLGDLNGVLECIMDGASVHAAVSMKNQENQTVCGVRVAWLVTMQRAHGCGAHMEIQTQAHAPSQHPIAKLFEVTQFMSPPQITPLFLAAQRGNTKVCKLLVENGANPNQPSYIEGSAELCTPAQVTLIGRSQIKG